MCVASTSLMVNHLKSSQTLYQYYAITLLHQVVRHQIKTMTCIRRHYPKRSKEKSRMFWVSADNNQPKDIENEVETTTCYTREMAEVLHDTNSLEFLALEAENRKLEEKVHTLLNEKEDLNKKNRDLQEKAESQSHMRCYNLKCNNKIDEFKYYTGLYFKHISHPFAISPQDCNTVSTNWLNYMFYRFRSISIWPEREVLIQNMSPKFREEFPYTLVTQHS